MFNIILAPNAFKESLTVEESIYSMHNSLQKYLPSNNISSYYLSDGGDGFLSAIQNQPSASNYTKINLTCKNALGVDSLSHYLILPSNTAVIEISQIIGLQGISSTPKNPLYASSYGVGQIIKHALDKGIRKFIIGLGGSATTDGGTGIAQALGFRFFKEEKKIPEELPEELSNKQSPLPDFTLFDFKNIDPRLQESHFKIICDVTNPLLGKKGCVQIFSPQKGTDHQQRFILEEKMKLWAHLSEMKTLNYHIKEKKGTGAAGGLGFFFQTYTQSTILSGSEWILKHSDLLNSLPKADLVITTEGQLDSQSVEGKLVSQLAKECLKNKVPLVAIVGSLQPGWEALQKQGLTAAFSISPHPTTLSDSIKNASLWLGQTTEQVYRLFSGHLL